MARISNGEGQAIKEKRRRKMSYQTRQHLPFYFMLLPGVLYLLMNNYLPMVGILIAFQDFRFKDNIVYSLTHSPWVGLENFKFLFKSPDMLIAMRNTILYNLVFIILGMVLPVAAAIALNEMRNKKGSKFYQSVMFLPYFLSWVVVSYLVFAMLSMNNGVVNSMIMRPLGFENKDWYSYPNLWPFILVFFNMWKTIGYNVVVYMATLSGINTEYYEAAAIDGASKWQQIKKITLPMIKPTIIILALLQVGKIFNSDFGMFWNLPMQRSAIYDTTNVIDTQIYRMLRTTSAARPGMPAAGGLFQSVIGCITVVSVNALVRKVDDDLALF